MKNQKLLRTLYLGNIFNTIKDVFVYKDYLLYCGWKEISKKSVARVFQTLKNRPIAKLTGYSARNGFLGAIRVGCCEVSKKDVAYLRRWANRK